METNLEQQPSAQRIKLAEVPRRDLKSWPMPVEGSLRWVSPHEDEISSRVSVFFSQHAYVSCTTHATSDISREVGGVIDVYSGYITGENLEVVPDARVVQRWRASDWPEGQYSTATFEFEAVEGGTQMTFTQTDVPDEHYDGIAQGWQEHYWTEMETMLTAQ